MMWLRLIPGALRLIPKWVWILLAVALLWRVAVSWHEHRAHAAIAAAEKRGEAKANAAWQQRFDAMRARADETRRRAEAASAKISKDVRRKNDQDNRDSAARARALSLSGPGAARCRPVDHPGLSGGAGRYVAPGGRPDAPGPQVPADDRAAVPWGWLVDRARQCDLNRAEALSWREADRRQRAEWEKLRDAKPAH